MHHPLSLALLALAPAAVAAHTTTKRGLVYFDSAWPEDAAVWTQPGSDLAWYYNYDDTPTSSIASGGTTLQFVPMMWGLRNDDPADTSFLANMQSLLSNAGDGSITHVLAFNEPDGDRRTGGSAIDTAQAAQAWVANFEPLRQIGVKVGLPAVTAAPTGLDWIRGFLNECRALLSHQTGAETDCAFDFVPVHWYDNFEAMARHIGQNAAMFPGKDIWVTEFAYPYKDLEATQEFFNAAMGYLDRAPDVARYSYFGTFRSPASNVGPSSAFLSADGELTDIGSWYLGFGATDVVPDAIAPRTRASRRVLFAISVSAAIGLS